MNSLTSDLKDLALTKKDDDQTQDINNPGSVPHGKTPANASSSSPVDNSSNLSLGSGPKKTFSYAAAASLGLRSLKSFEFTDTPRLSFGSLNSSLFPPLRSMPAPLSLPSSSPSDVGKVFMVLGVGDTADEHKGLHKKLDKGAVLKGHMVVCNSEVIKDNMIYLTVGTFTTKHVDGLDAMFVVPIFPFAGDFKPNNTHFIQYRLDNEDDKWTPSCGRDYNRKTNLNTYLRQDNVYYIPKCLLKESEGEDGGPMRLSPASLATYLDFLKTHDIVEGSQKDPLWKVKAVSPPPATPRSGRGRGYGRGGYGIRGGQRRRGSQSQYGSPSSLISGRHASVSTPQGSSTYSTPSSQYGSSRRGSPLGEHESSFSQYGSPAIESSQNRTQSSPSVLGDNTNGVSYYTRTNGGSNEPVDDDDEGWTEVQRKNKRAAARRHIPSGRENQGQYGGYQNSENTTSVNTNGRSRYRGNIHRGCGRGGYRGFGN